MKMSVQKVSTQINITPMSMGELAPTDIGVLGIPVSCTSGWIAVQNVVQGQSSQLKTLSKKGIFIYADRASSVTITPKHVNQHTKTAPAWQFTVTDGFQLQQLERDGNLPLNLNQQYKQLDCTVYPMISYPIARNTDVIVIIVDRVI